ncbi:MAG: hypothetical protein J5787_05910 [Alphaproteobacteria bacterium]|nr:hypothetical protein [Alphaproteobacteria bacterium]
MEKLAKYWSVTKTADFYGFTRKTVLEMCAARGSRFAFKLKENGRYYIDPKLFKQYIDRKRREGA